MSYSKLDDLEQKLLDAGKLQDKLETSSINLIAADNATNFKYLHNLPYKRYAITEGLLGKRPYAGVKYFDEIERIAVEAACEVFGAEYANVQPHCGSQANQGVYQGLLDNGDTVLAMSFDAGGHLTHGLKKNFSGRFFNFIFYGLDPKTDLINYKEIEEKAKQYKPKLIVCGASSYPRAFDFEKLARIAKKYGAYLMADLCHPAGLIAAKRYPNPFPSCDIVTLTYDKTLRGPHGGIILAKKILADRIDKGLHPGTQSSVPLQRIYQAAMCLIDAGRKDYQKYIDRLILNIKVLENTFKKFPNLLLTGGTDSNMLVLNTYKVFGVTGKEAEFTLEEIGILSNRQVVPNDALKPYISSGLRLGTAWATSRGYTKKDFEQIASILVDIFKNPRDEKIKTSCRNRVAMLVKQKRKKDTWLL